MKISNNKCHILIETSTDELEKNGLDIHSILTICEYPSLDYLNSLLKDNLYGNINDLYISSIYFSNGNWIIDLDLKNEFKIKEKNNTNIKNAAIAIHVKYMGCFLINSFMILVF